MIRQFKILLLLLMGCAFPVLAQTQEQTAEVSISTKLERDTILIGDQIGFSIVAKMPSAVKVIFPQVTDTLGNGVEVIGRPAIDSAIANGVATYTMRMLVTSFDSGLAVIPGLAFRLQYMGQIDSIFSPQRAFIVNVLPPDPNKKDIFDVKPPMREPITFAEVAPWVGVGLLFIGVVVLIVLYFVKRKQNKPFLKIFKPAEPAHVLALRELEQIKEQKLWADENQKLYYTKLTDVLRAYLEGRFAIDAQEKTSSEILAELQNTDFNFGSRFQQLQDLLFTSDLVKFAKHLPLINENEQYLNFSIDFVNSTKPEDKPTEAEKTDAHEVADAANTADASNSAEVASDDSSKVAE